MRKKRYWFAMLPAVFMIVTTLASLVILLKKYLSQSKYILSATDVLLFVLALGIIALAGKTFLGPRDRKEET